MTRIDTPKAADILCGKDKTFGKHPGNMLYRDLIEAKALDYANATYKLDKMKLTTEIVDTMVSEFGSRFLRPVGPHTSTDNVDGSVRSVYGWEEISLTAARDKTSHALRFCAAHSISRRSFMKSNVDFSVPSTAINTEHAVLLPTIDQESSSEDQPNDHSGIDEIIQQKLKQIEREKEQQMLLLMNQDESLGKAARKFKKLPITKLSTVKKPKVSTTTNLGSRVKAVRSPRKPKVLVGEEAMALATNSATPTTEGVEMRKHMSSYPQLPPPPPIPPPMKFYGAPPLL
jgi:hypothetical protein